MKGFLVGLPRAPQFPALRTPDAHLAVLARGRQPPAVRGEYSTGRLGLQADEVARLFLRPRYVPALQGMGLPSGDDELAVGREGDAGPAVEPGQLAVALLPQVVPFEAAQVRLSRPGAQALQALLNARVIVLFPADLQVAHGDRVVG